MTRHVVVSVVIPTRDRWAQLRLALRSALAQTLRDIEVIVVDDGSVDETRQRLEAVRDPRLVVVRHARAEGVARARNAALKRARGRWIAFLDDDDVWAPAKLERQVAVAAASGADFISTIALEVNRDGVVVGRQHPRIDDLERELLRWNVIGGPSTVMVESRLVAKVGGFDEHLAVLADWELWLRLARHCRAAVVEEPLTALFDHGGNMQVTAIDRVADELRYMATVHEGRVAGFDRAFRSPRVVELLAYNHRRAGHTGPALEGYLRLARHRPVYALTRVLLCMTEGLTGRRLPSRRRRREAAPAWLAAVRSSSESRAGATPARRSDLPT